MQVPKTLTDFLKTVQHNTSPTHQRSPRLWSLNQAIQKYSVQRIQLANKLNTEQHLVTSDYSKQQNNKMTSPRNNQINSRLQKELKTATDYFDRLETSRVQTVHQSVDLREDSLCQSLAGDSLDEGSLNDGNQSPRLFSVDRRGSTSPV